jgi:DNA-binding FadR family transcriptional regulator
LVKEALVEYVTPTGTFQPVIIEWVIADGEIPPDAARHTENDFFERFDVMRFATRESASQVGQERSLQRRKSRRLFVFISRGFEGEAALHRNLSKTLQCCHSEIAAQWPQKHTFDFQRDFALAGLDMSATLVKSQ